MQGNVIIFANIGIFIFSGKYLGVEFRTEL